MKLGCWVHGRFLPGRGDLVWPTPPLPAWVSSGISCSASFSVVRPRTQIKQRDATRCSRRLTPCYATASLLTRLPSVRRLLVHVCRAVLGGTCQAPPPPLEASPPLSERRAPFVLPWLWPRAAGTTRGPILLEPPSEFTLASGLLVGGTCTATRPPAGLSQTPAQ